MKTIKDFKMKCENIQQRDEVIRILEENGYKDFSNFDSNELILCLLSGIIETREYDTGFVDNFTSYHQFMQLYAEPKQDELKELKEWVESKDKFIQFTYIELINKINEMIERRNK